MPYTRLQKANERKKHYALGLLIIGTVKVTNRERRELAKMMGCSESTVWRRLSEPGTLTVDELTALGRGLHIPIEELRAAIRY